MTRRFVDTNVFVYAWDTSDPIRKEQALAVLESGGPLIVSTQVIHETSQVLLRKYGVAPTILLKFLEAEMWPRCEVSSNPTVVGRALALYETYSLSFYDALILASAEASRCAVVLTEDMQGQARIGHVQIVNPFALS